jgi:CRISPR-associated protein Csm3
MTTERILRGKYIIKGQIKCLTGLHIGSPSAGIEIGGLENPVLKDPLTEWPYIPGSSLKGKLRSLMEWGLGLIALHPKHKGYAAYSCEDELKNDRETFQDKQRYDAALALARMFGPASDDTKVRALAGPTRLTIRDAFPTKPTLDTWNQILGEGIFTEVKTENALDRVTAEANPRPIERVPAGSAFDLEMIFDVYKGDEHSLLKELLAAMRLLEHSALGGSGSRGHGQVKFELSNVEWRPLEYYRTGEGVQPVALPGTDVESLLQGFDGIQWP